MTKELKVGEKITIAIELIEQDSCDGCFFSYNGTCYNPTINEIVEGFECRAKKTLGWQGRRI